MLWIGKIEIRKGAGEAGPAIRQGSGVSEALVHVICRLTDTAQEMHLRACMQTFRTGLVLRAGKGNLQKPSGVMV